MLPDNTFFSNWAEIFRTVVVGVPAYLFLLLALRVSGKRSLAQMNAFDLVVTVSIGSTLATTLLAKETALLKGVTALSLLVALQWVITAASVRSRRIRKLVRADPALLFHERSFVESAMKRERVSHDEVLQAVRSNGLGGLEDVGSVIMETNGSFSVLPRSSGRPEKLLSNVARAKGEASEARDDD